jgi:hypothetical protein
MEITTKYVGTWLEDEPNNSGGGLLAPKVLGKYHVCTCTNEVVHAYSSFACTQEVCDG